MGRTNQTVVSCDREGCRKTVLVNTVQGPQKPPQNWWRILDPLAYYPLEFCSIGCLSRWAKAKAKEEWFALHPAKEKEEVTSG